MWVVELSKSRQRILPWSCTAYLTGFSGLGTQLGFNFSPLSPRRCSLHQLIA